MESHRSWAQAGLRIERDGAFAATTADTDPESQQNDEFNFDQLQMELQKLQQQLQEHGNVLFGSEIASQTEVPDPPPAPAKRTHLIPPSALPVVEEKVDYNHHPYEESTSLSRRRKRDSSDASEQRKEIETLRRQLAEEREELRRLRALRGATEEKMASRIGQLEERVRILLNREKNLEKRRFADTTGWRAELTILRQSLLSIERKQRRLAVLCSVADEDHRCTVLARQRKLDKEKRGGGSKAAALAREYLQPRPHNTTAAVGSHRKRSQRHSHQQQQQQKEEEEEDDDTKIFDEEEGLRGCLFELSEELSALRVALGGLEQQILR